jgi:alpha-2-macroglobulin
LPQGRHNLSYQLRAEIPGTFSALPTRAEAMYAPELKANSDEMKIEVRDQ